MTTPAQRLAELRAAATQGEWTRTGLPWHKLHQGAKLLFKGVGQDIFADQEQQSVVGCDQEFVCFAANHAPAIAARERELEEEIATANHEIDHRDGELAAACDMLNCWCRESGVEECSSPYEGLGLQKTIDRLWGCVNEKHYKQLTAKDAEIAKLRAAAKSFLFWFDADGTPVDGFRFQDERVKLEEALKQSEATDRM